MQNLLTLQKRQAYAQADKYPTGQPVHDSGGARVPFKPATEPASQQGDDDVDERAGDVEEHSQDDNLQRNRTIRRAGELRQEGQEEERDLGIEHVGDDALREDAPERRLLDLGSRQAALTAEQIANAQVDEIASTDELHEIIGQGHSSQNTGEAQRDQAGLNDAAARDSQRRSQSRAPPLVRTARNDIEHVRSGYDVQRPGGQQKERKRGQGYHAFLPFIDNAKMALILIFHVLKANFA